MIRPLIAILCLFFLPCAAWAKPLVADLSQYRIEIDSSFTGTRLLLFGSRNDIGDIVIVVRGPEKKYVVRRKERVAGIWMNRDRQRFDKLPSYYTVASSKLFQDMRHTELFIPLRIGLKETVMGNDTHIDPAFVVALIRYQQSQGLYTQLPQKVSFMGESLFKLAIPFPDTIPGGGYSADVYLFSDGKLQGMQSIPIEVKRIGFDAFVYDFAHDHSVLYGFISILLALGMGWGASTLMQRI